MSVSCDIFSVDVSQALMLILASRSVSCYILSLLRVAFIDWLLSLSVCLYMYVTIILIRVLRQAVRYVNPVDFFCIECQNMVFGTFWNLKIAYLGIRCLD